MKIRILETFWRYPDGRGQETFHEGQVVEVSDDDAALFVAKGHAEAVGPSAVASPRTDAPDA